MARQYSAAPKAILVVKDVRFGTLIDTGAEISGISDENFSTTTTCMRCQLRHTMQERQWPTVQYLGSCHHQYLRTTLSVPRYPEHSTWYDHWMGYYLCSTWCVDSHPNTIHFKTPKDVVLPLATTNAEIASIRPTISTEIVDHGTKTQQLLEKTLWW